MAAQSRHTTAGGNLWETWEVRWAHTVSRVMAARGMFVNWQHRFELSLESYTWIIETKIS